MRRPATASWASLRAPSWLLCCSSSSCHLQHQSRTPCESRISSIDATGMRHSRYASDPLLPATASIPWVYKCIRGHRQPGAVISYVSDATACQVCPLTRQAAKQCTTFLQAFVECDVNQSCRQAALTLPFCCFVLPVMLRIYVLHKALHLLQHFLRLKGLALALMQLSLLCLPPVMLCWGCWHHI